MTPGASAIMGAIDPATIAAAVVATAVTTPLAKELWKSPSETDIGNTCGSRGRLKTLWMPRSKKRGRDEGISVEAGGGDQLAFEKVSVVQVTQSAGKAEVLEERAGLEADAKIAGDAGELQVNAEINMKRVKVKEEAKEAGEKDGEGSVNKVLFGEEKDDLQICRLPRILRVKMGCGRLLKNLNG